MTWSLMFENIASSHILLVKKIRCTQNKEKKFKSSLSCEKQHRHGDKESMMANLAEYLPQSALWLPIFVSMPHAK